MRAVLTLAVLMLAGLAGCVDSGSDDPDQDEEETTPVRPVLEDGRVKMDIPVDVVLLGFSDEVVQGLSGALEPFEVDHLVYNNARLFVTDLAEPAAPTMDNWMLPTAQYTVHDLDEAHAELLGAMPAMVDGDGFYNATAVEDWLADALPRHGVGLDASAPALVFLRLDGLEDHRYRLEYVTGYIDNVRVLGERHPMLVMDVSAPADPWVGTAYDWNRPAPDEDDRTLEVLLGAVESATKFRLLQGPLYPATLRPCHGVSLIVAVRGTSISEVLPGYTPAGDYLDTGYLLPVWEHLLGEGNVHIDASVLQLPVDDPPLDQVLRSGDLNTLRYYFDENWEQYWVPHEGCEAYISIFLAGDASDSGISGIAMFDIRDGRRISLSNFNDLDRVTGDEGELSVVFEDDPRRDRFDWIHMLFSHETGHLFGQRHPHDISAREGGGGEFTWSSIWSVMSYQQDGKLPEFGTMDVNNQWRNRAASALVIAQDQGLEGSAEFDAALDHMAQRHWQAAAEALLPVIDPVGLAPA